jgi:hypothetical protein
MANYKRTSIIWTKIDDDEFRDLIAKSISYKEALHFFGFDNKGSNNKTIKARIKHLNISVSHFNPKHYKAGQLSTNRKIPLSDILVENSTYPRTKLKKRLIENGMLKEVCSICGCKDKWQDKKLIMILDHINGVNNDNRIENLRLTCPNCGSQLDTHAGRNKKRVTYYCESCGEEKKTKYSKNCNTCSKLERRKIKRPSREALLKDVENLGYEGTGRKYKISGNSIRNWLK